MWLSSCFRLATRHAKMRKWKNKITTLKTWRVIAWRPFAPPGENTTNSTRKRDAWYVAYFRVAGRKVAMRKNEKVTIWRVFAWRPFAFTPRKHAYTTWHKSATISQRLRHALLLKSLPPRKDHVTIEYHVRCLVFCMHSTLYFVQYGEFFLS